MTKKLTIKLLATIFTPFIATSSLAQSLKIGDSDLLPSTEIRFLSNSNAFLTPDDETDTTALVVSPRVEWLAQRRLLSLSLVYEGDYAAYSEDVLDYDDHLLGFTATAELGVRKRVRGEIQFSREHEVLGTLITRGLADENTEQVESTNIEAETSFGYGARNAKGNLEVGLRVADVNFTNQAQLTDGRGYTQFAPFGLFSFRLSSDTRLLLEGSISDLNYDDELRDRTDVTTFLGISLGENRKTSGTAKVGYSQASFEQNGRGDEDAVVAEVLLSWSPVDFSNFDLSVSREFDNSDSTAAENLTIDDSIRLGWSHSWSARVKTDAFVSRVGRDRDCPELDTATASAGVQIAFSVRRWLVLGAGVSVASRSSDDCPTVDSDDEELDFDRGLGNIFLRAKL